MHPAFSSIPKIVDFAEVNQWRSLEESWQYLENVDWTHLVLASGKLVLQKNVLDRREGEKEKASTWRDF